MERGGRDFPGRRREGYAGDPGRGRGGFGGRGRGDFGGRGRGDFGGRGRGQGGGDFGGGPPARFALERELEEGTAGRPGRRTQLSTPEEAAEQMAKMQLIYPDDLKELMVSNAASRPGVGTEGRALTVRANHFRVECDLKQAFHYDVNIKSVIGDAREGQPARQRPVDKPLPPDILCEVMRALSDQQQWAQGWAYDGNKNLYTASRFLPQGETTFEVTIRDPKSHRQRAFTVTTKWAADVNIGDLMDFIKKQNSNAPQQAIQALDVALKHSSLMSAHTLTIGGGRAIFRIDDSPKTPLGSGAEVWTGYSQSLLASDGCLSLNIDMSCTAFLEQSPVISYLAKAVNIPGQMISEMNKAQHRKATKAIAGLKVEVIHMGNRNYKVRDLTSEGASELMFFNDDINEEQSVAQYFERRYRKLQHPQAPCLNVGTATRPIYLPTEVCKIAKGQRRLKLDERQTAEMIKVAAKKPRERAAFIEQAVTQRANFPEDPTVNAFGMRVVPRMMEINARLLRQPDLQYRAPYKTPPHGSWNLKNHQFFKPASLPAYAIVSFMTPDRVGRHNDPGSLMAFMTELLGQLRKCGLQTPEPFDLPEIVFHDRNRAFPGESLHRAMDLGKQYFKQDPRIIFVLLPDTGAELYAEVKRSSDSFLGIPSQCFVACKAAIGMPQNKPRDQYTANLALKINTKLDGVNCIVPKKFPWQSQPYMVFGADVTHMRSSQETEPSIAAVCGSIDENATRFASCTRLQSHGMEIIQDLASCVDQLLRAFYKNTRRKPSRLIFYRDGVSNGQFPEVMRSEVPQVIAACRSLGERTGEPYSPPLTFIIIQKRHNTRFFPMSEREADRSGNCMPGTVVDTQIVHPSQFSFFLNSHAGIQGTSRCAHYSVLLDQNRFGADELQAFTYNQTYTFARCTRSVSICPAAYYAHLVADRARHLVSNYEQTTSSDTESTHSGAHGIKGGKHVDFARPHANLDSHMYFV